METSGAAARLGAFAIGSAPPAEARARAAGAVLDTIGVTLAGASEPAAGAVQRMIAAAGDGGCRVFGTSTRAPAGAAALANGTAAHALDFDDMCFVSLAHPSAPLVPAAFAAAEVAGASGRELLDAYVVGFEIEARLGRAMNPRHYRRGWHCTSTIGAIGAAAAASRLLRLDADAAGHAIGIAASSASGLKENFGSMVKPLHAGLAAQHGVVSAMLAGQRMTASALAIEGPQGFLAAMDSERPSCETEMQDLGTRWEILDTGITVKLYPSCAGTHPALDAILELRRRERFSADAVEAVDVEVDAVTPTILIYDRPATGLEAKFSMPFCAAAAIVFGHVGIDTFEDGPLADARVTRLMPHVRMRVGSSLDASAQPLTQAQVTIRLRDGRLFSVEANGARGYPERPASTEDLDAKFLVCARKALSDEAARHALARLRTIDAIEDIRSLTQDFGR